MNEWMNELNWIELTQMFFEPLFYASTEPGNEYLLENKIVPLFNLVEKTGNK